MLRFSAVNVTKSQFPVDLVTLAEEILNGNFIFYALLLKTFEALLAIVENLDNIWNTNYGKFQTFHKF